jgi:hypothetical protein
MNNINLLVSNVKHLHKTLIRFIDIIISMLNKFQEAYPTRQYLGERLGITEQHVSRLSEWLVAHGYLIKTYRHMTSCVYTLPDYFFDFWTRVALRSYFPAIKAITLQVGMLYGSPVKEMLRDIYIGNTPYVESVVKKDLIAQIVRELRLSKERGETINEYDYHIIEYSIGIVRRKISEGHRFGSLEGKRRYFFAILNGQASLKSRSYDPKEPLFKDRTEELPVVTQVSPSKDRWGRMRSAPTGVDIKRAIEESVVDLELIDDYDPVIDFNSTLSTIAPLSLLENPTNEQPIAPSANIVVDLAPPQVTMPSKDDVMQYVSDNYGLLSHMDRKIHETKRSSCRVEYDSMGNAHVVSKLDDGLLAFAQMAMQARRDNISIQKNIFKEVGNAMGISPVSPKDIQIAGAFKDMVAEQVSYDEDEAGWWALQTEQGYDDPIHQF